MIWLRNAEFWVPGKSRTCEKLLHTKRGHCLSMVHGNGCLEQRKHHQPSLQCWIDVRTGISESLKQSTPS
jgi:hypothetical protein